MHSNSRLPRRPGFLLSGNSIAVIPAETQLHFGGDDGVSLRQTVAFKL